MPSVQEVRRKLDLSLDDLVKEEKSQGAKRRRGSQGGGNGGRPRTSVGSSSFENGGGVSPAPALSGKGDRKGDKPYNKGVSLELEKRGSDSVPAATQEVSEVSEKLQNPVGGGEGVFSDSARPVARVVAPLPLQPYPPPVNPYGPPAQPPLGFGPWNGQVGYYGMPAYGYWPQPPPPMYHYGLPPPHVSAPPLDVRSGPMHRPPGDCSRPPVAAQGCVRPPSQRHQKEVPRPMNDTGGHGARRVPPPQAGHQVKLCNIPPELTARDLAEAFGKISQNRVESVEVLRDSSGAPTSEAYIVFNCHADALHAVRRYHGGDLNGRQLRVLYEGEVNLKK